MSYFDAAIGLTPYQKSKIAIAVRNGTGTHIQLSNADLSGPHKIRLTHQQIARIKKAKAKGVGVVLKLSKTQLAKQGGFLGALLGGLAASLLPQLLGGLTGKGVVLPGTPVSGRGKKKASKRPNSAGNQTLVPLSNGDIDLILRGVANYRGTYSKDMLPKSRKRDESLVVNLEDYFAGGGTHWVAIYNHEYFDSFGLSPPLEIVRYMGPDIQYNSSQIQGMNYIMCGYYCCYYIVERYRGRNPLDILLDFHFKPTVFNEAWIRQFAHIVSKSANKQNAPPEQHDTRERRTVGP